MTAFTPHQDIALKAVADWLRAKPGRTRHAAGVPPVRLCRHRQDDARAPHRRGRRGRGEIRRLHRQGGAGHAQQGLRRRLHHPLADLPRARDARRAADLRAVGRRTGLQGEADHHRRMLDGRRRARPRPDVVRLPAAGARRPGAAAADPGRRLLHQRRARCDAHGSSPAGAGRSDRAAVDGRTRRTRHRSRRLWRDRGRPPQRARSGARDAGRPGAGRPQQHAARLQHAHPREAGHHRSSARSPATSSCACATTARRRCSTADCGG